MTIRQNKYKQSRSLNNSLATDRLQSLWPILPFLLQIINYTACEISEGGQYSRLEISKNLARYSKRWPVPDEFLCAAEKFILDILNIALTTDDNGQEFCQTLKSLHQPRTRYLVFHHGRYHYSDEISEDVRKLKDSILFWANFADKTFFSQGQQRTESEWLTAQQEEVLCYLCLHENAGRTIPFQELNSNIWKAEGRGELQSIENSVNGVISQINSFTNSKLISTTSHPESEQQADEKILRIRSKNKFRVGKNAHTQVCIIRETSSMSN